jgi:predicted phosphoribosyltransferase
VAVHDTEELRERAPVFVDREDGGVALAALLRTLPLEAPLILAIPAGGVPVAVAVARETGWPLDVAVVSKITLPWNSEAGFGAVAFDGSVWLDHDRTRLFRLDEEAIEAGIARTRIKVERRSRRLRGEGPLAVAGRSAILVDDGLASGATMACAIEAVRRLGPARLVAAAPTAHRDAARRASALADEVVCPNLRAALPFAVADAYERWQDVPEVVADELLRPHRERGRRGPWASRERA